MMTETFHVLEIRQTASSSSHELPHGNDAVLVLVQTLQYRRHDILGLVLMFVVGSRFGSGGLVVKTVDGLEFGFVEDAISIQVVEREEGLCVGGAGSNQIISLP